MLSWQTFRLIYWHIKLLRGTPTTTSPLPSPCFSTRQIHSRRRQRGWRPSLQESSRLQTDSRAQNASHLQESATRRCTKRLWENGEEKKKEEGFTAVVQRGAGIFRKNCKKINQPRQKIWSCQPEKYLHSCESLPHLISFWQIYCSCQLQSM